MKRILSYIFLFLLTTSHAVAQIPKTIDAPLLRVMRPACIYRSVGLNDSIISVVPLLGHPTKITVAYFEMTDEQVEYYWYGKSRLIFSHGRLHGYEIKDKNLCIGDGKGLAVHIGDKIKTTTPNAALNMPSTAATKIRSFWPFELNDTPGTTRNIRYKAIVAGAVKFPTYIDDRVACLLFNKSDKLFNIFL